VTCWQDVAMTGTRNFS